MSSVYVEHLDETFTEDELDEMPTLCQGQESDLKVDRDGFRVWLSRCSVADYAGAPTEPDHPIQYERLINGRWVSVDRHGDPL